MMTRRPLPQDSNALQLAARQALFRYLSWAFADPVTGSWERMSDPAAVETLCSAAELLRESSTTPPAVGRGEFPIEDLDPDRMLDRLPATGALLNDQYERTFGLLATSANSPYETEYIGGKLAFQRSQHLADVAGFYRAFGLEIHAERPDHLALQLEFMASVIGLERQAAEDSAADGGERCAVCRRAQSRFLDEHLVWWVPAFVRLLSREHPHGFYSAAGRFLCSLLPAERALFGIDAPTGAVEPSPLESPDSCEGCLLDENLLEFKASG